MTKPNPANENTQIEAPAKVTSLHVQDRTFRNEAEQLVTGQTAWRKLTHLQSYFQNGRLAGGNPKYSENARYEAGLEYARLHDTWRPGGKDSTQALNISRSTGGDGGRTAAAFAGMRIACIHSHLGERDRQILMKVLADGYSPAEAVRTACGDYRDTVAARFREALDGLCEALETARRDGWKTINMEVRE